MILIFDTFGGLCNQFYDIQCALNFCLIHNIKFCFRYASFRYDNLISWYNVPFYELFDTSFFNKYDTYVNYNDLILSEENTFNYENSVCCNNFLVRNNILKQLLNLKKDYIVLKQFWDIYAFNKIVEDVNSLIRPSSNIMKIYTHVKTELELKDNNYNFIHYRYEHDFINHFNITKMKTLKEIILNNYFKDKNLKIYIATTKINDFLHDLNDFNNIIYKNEESLKNLNFEEKAFIDYMIGLNNNEVVGHSNSAFSGMLNLFKKSNNYYNYQ